MNMGAMLCIQNTQNNAFIVYSDNTFNFDFVSASSTESNSKKYTEKSSSRLWQQEAHINKGFQ